MDKPKRSVRKTPTAAPKDRAALAVFRETWSSNTRFFDAGGNALFVTNDADDPYKPQKHNGIVSAIAWLGIGEAPFTMTKAGNTRENLNTIRVGDVAGYPGHAWLVGDVRYGVWFLDATGAKTSPKPSYVVDQSSFIDYANGWWVKRTSTDGLDEDCRSSKWKTRNGNPAATVMPLTAADTREIERLDGTFDATVKAFVTSTAKWGALSSPQGGEGTLDPAGQQIEVAVIAWRCFTANGTTKTFHNIEYKRITNAYEERKVRAADGTDEQTIRVPKYAMQKTGVAPVKATNAGVTRPWNLAATHLLSIARMYGPG